MTAETETAQATSCCSSTGSCRGGGATEDGAGGVTAVYEVKGMTCGHCEGAVSEEVSGIEGVTSVKAVASTGLVTVTWTPCARPSTKPVTSSSARSETPLFGARIQQGPAAMGARARLP